jgi:hypothetical protein
VHKVEQKLTISQERMINEACVAAVTQAASAGVAITACDVVEGDKAIQQKGDKAIVALRIESKPTKHYWIVQVPLDGSVWKAGQLQVVGGGKTK